jgi:hypothetical protein
MPRETRLGRRLLNGPRRNWVKLRNPAYERDDTPAPAPSRGRKNELCPPGPFAVPTRTPPDG